MNNSNEPTPTPRLYPMSALLSEATSEATEAHEAKKAGRPRGPLTGLKSLDEKIGGALPPLGVSAILGNTGAGKTAFAGQVAASCQCPALYVTTEMAPVELFRRHAARTTGEFLGRFKSGEMTPDRARSLFEKTASAMPLLHICDATTAYASVSYLRDVLEVVKGEAPHALLIVDSLHSWARAAPGTGGSEYDTLNEHLTALQRLSHATRVCVLFIAEQSRAAIKEGAAGNVNAGAGTRFIEYGAELVFDLQAEAKTNGADERAVRLTIAKNRHGAAGVTVPLKFQTALQRFEVSE